MIRFFFGEDTFRLNEKINEIKEDFFKKTPNANLGVFDCLEKNCLDDLFLAILHIVLKYLHLFSLKLKIIKFFK